MSVGACGTDAGGFGRSALVLCGNDLESCAVARLQQVNRANLELAACKTLGNTAAWTLRRCIARIAADRCKRLRSEVASDTLKPD